MADTPLKSFAASVINGDVKSKDDDDLIKAVADFAAEYDMLRGATDPPLVDAAIAKAIAEVRAANTFEGVLVAPEEALAKVEAAKRGALDRAVVEAATALAASLPKLKAAIDAEMEAAQSLPPSPTDPVRRALELQERGELRLRYNGRPVKELLALYQASPDKERRDIAAFIEDEAAADWPTLHPRITERDDVPAMAALQQAIRARRMARIPKHLIDAAGTLAEYQSPAKSLWLAEVRKIGASASREIVSIKARRTA